MISSEGILLRIFISEGSRYKHHPLSKVIIEQAHKMKLKGATVFRGISGFQGKGPIHETGILSLSENLPLVIEIVDKEKAINKFILYLDEVIDDGLITTEKINIHKSVNNGVSNIFNDD